MGDIFSMIVSLPISIYVNSHCLSLKTSIKLPTFIGYKIHVDKLSRILPLAVIRPHLGFVLDGVVQKEEK